MRGLVSRTPDFNVSALNPYGIKWDEVVHPAEAPKETLRRFRHRSCPILLDPTPAKQNHFSCGHWEGHSRSSRSASDPPPNSVTEQLLPTGFGSKAPSPDRIPGFLDCTLRLRSREDSRKWLQNIHIRRSALFPIDKTIGEPHFHVCFLLSLATVDNLRWRRASTRSRSSPSYVSSSSEDLLFREPSIHAVIYRSWPW